MSNGLIDQKPKKLTDKQRIRLLKREVAILHKALGFYADPTTYFATSILTDPPSGDFCRDYGKITSNQEHMFGWDAYRGEKDAYYGKAARVAIEKAYKLWEKFL